jgi:hypothetical protein
VGLDDPRIVSEPLFAQMLACGIFFYIDGLALFVAG